MAEGRKNPVTSGAEETPALKYPVDSSHLANVPLKRYDKGVDDRGLGELWEIIFQNLIPLPGIAVDWPERSVNCPIGRFGQSPFGLTQHLARI